jgi:hypothetical protein
MLQAMHAACAASGFKVVETERYRQAGRWLVLFGVGAAVHAAARDRHVAAGGRAVLFDLGYFGRQKITGYLKLSLDHDHPQAWLDRSPPDTSRWDAHGIRLREDADPTGPIILVGLGRKARAYLKAETWESKMLGNLRKRFPDRKIIHRPKGKDFPTLDCPVDDTSTIEQLLKGASLAVCRHSNVAVDAAVAGVPYEAVDGAAMWLAQREYSVANRLEFLQRLCWWQWRAVEAPRAWSFVREVTGG